VKANADSSTEVTVCKVKKLRGAINGGTERTDLLSLNATESQSHFDIEFRLKYSYRILISVSCMLCYKYLEDFWVTSAANLP
jgi:hypothetical protein